MTTSGDAVGAPRRRSRDSRGDSPTHRATNSWRSSRSRSVQRSSDRRVVRRAPCEVGSGSSVHAVLSDGPLAVPAARHVARVSPRQLFAKYVHACASACRSGAGLVTRGPEAHRRSCRIVARPLAEANAFLESYRRFWEQSFERLDALKRRTPYRKVAVTETGAVPRLNRHRVCVLPPSQVTRDQVTDRLARSSTRSLLVKQALPVFPLDTLSPPGLDVTVPARPVTPSVTFDLPAAHAPAAGFTVKAATGARCRTDRPVRRRSRGPGRHSPRMRKKPTRTAPRIDSSSNELTFCRCVRTAPDHNDEHRHLVCPSSSISQLGCHLLPASFHPRSPAVVDVGWASDHRLHNWPVRGPYSVTSTAQVAGCRCTMNGSRPAPGSFARTVDE
jgi:hypothetical protein